MKNKLLLFAVIFAAVIIAACSGENKPSQQFPEEGPQMVLSNSDTVTVQTMVNDFLELVKTGRAEEAVNMLYSYENDEVKPLSDAQKQECLMTYGMFDYKGYRITSFVFFKETDSEVNFELYLDDPATSAHPRTFKNLIRPVRRNDTWYITLANGHQKSEIHQDEE